MTSLLTTRNGEAIPLTNRSGRTYSDSTTTSWDAVAATSNGSGFQVLRDGASSKEGKFYVWTTNSSGVITKGSGWKTTTQAVTNGWENTFATDFNNDGLISGGRSYQLASSAGSITLTNRSGHTTPIPQQLPGCCCCYLQWLRLPGPP